MQQEIYTRILQSQKRERKQLALLIDPDKFRSAAIVKEADKAGVDLFFVGGSLLTNGDMDRSIQVIRDHSDIPVVLFPGNFMQTSKQADALLFLSLISGRNPDLLIGQHVAYAPLVKSSGLEVISTGYMLIESGKYTAAVYMSQSSAIPADQDDIAMSTAMAGEMLGMKMIYLDAGSGALHPVNQSMIQKVRKNISIPLIVGGGIRNAESARRACAGGADLIVVGNAAEKRSGIIQAISQAIHTF